jgi:hypothetical protein
VVVEWVSVAREVEWYNKHDRLNDSKTTTTNVSMGILPMEDIKRWLVDKLVACNKLISQDIKSADNIIIFVLVEMNQLPVPTDNTSTSSVNTEIVKK